MKLQRADKIEILLAVIFFILGCLYGSAVEFKYQKAIYEILRNTSAIIFGVVGAWYAVITPLYLGNKNKNSREEKYARQLLKNLLTPIKYSVYILCITILFQLLYPLSTLITISNDVAIILKAFSFGIVSSLTVLMLFTLLRSLIPNDFVHTDIQIKEEKLDYQERIMNQNKRG